MGASGHPALGLAKLANLHSATFSGVVLEQGWPKAIRSLRSNLNTAKGSCCSEIKEAMEEEVAGDPKHHKVVSTL
jgi:hypothetical protein